MCDFASISHFQEAMSVYAAKLTGLGSRFNPNSFESVYHSALANQRPVEKAERQPATRLKIVLDLDNTLLHAMSLAKLNNIDVNLEDFFVDGKPELFLFSLPQLQDQRFLLKLRPFVRTFLEELHEVCELSIHTNATREYADVVLSILDPDRLLFGNRCVFSCVILAKHEPQCTLLTLRRIVARTQDVSNDLKKDLDRLYDFSSTNSDILIFDDRADVWDTKLQGNIVRCAVYAFLEHQREALCKRYGGRTYLLAQSMGPVVDNDQLLSYLLPVLKSVATEFTEKALRGEPVHVRDLLHARRSTVLDGCRVLLTGFNKSGQKSTYGFQDSGPRFKAKIQALGAKVVESATDEITHVVVMRHTNTTQKAM